MNWTAEQIIAFAHDAASAKAGQALAAMRNWQALGSNEQAAWGLCQGSGKDPYQTQIDLTEPAFRCTCPSRKFPCKHALGLFLLLAKQASIFNKNSPPEWVTEWLATRTKRAQVSAEKRERAPDRTAQDRRAADREARVASGLQELELWLSDLVRGGLAKTQAQSPQFWERTAARLVDAQASGAARMVRQLAFIPSSGEGWQARLLEGISRIYLLLEGFKRIGQLSAETQADIRAHIGWTQNQEELLQNDGIRDNWLALGLRVEEDDRLRLQRVWLQGERSNRFAMLLNFVVGNQPFDVSLVPGTVIDAELVFYPGAFPLRALIKEQNDSPSQFDHVQRFADLTGAFASYAAALACDPWLEKFPFALQGVIPVQRDGQWSVRDAGRNLLRLDPRSSHQRSLLALSGGREIALFGEFDGEQLWPLSAIAEGRFVRFHVV
jgi:SWIM zinc finger